MSGHCPEARGKGGAVGCSLRRAWARGAPDLEGRRGRGAGGREPEKAQSGKKLGVQGNTQQVANA